MKRIILNFEEKLPNFSELVQEAYNMDFLNFLISAKTFSEFEKIERITTYSTDVNLNAQKIILKEINDELLNLNRDFGLYWEIESKQDEQKIIDESKKGQFSFFIIKAKDWKVIPFENIIANMHKTDTELIASVENVEEAELMLKTLEIGTDGILITPKNANEIANLKKLLVSKFQIKLNKANIVGIQKISESERVCVDSTSLLKPGEGMLVGSTAKGFVLVHAEVFDTQFVSSRPFRVNAGDVSAYILVPDVEENQYRTKYLSELHGGDNVIVINSKGYTKIVTVGRVKIETRPMIRLELLIKEENKEIRFSYIGQNAETIRLVDHEGNPKSIVDIKIGDQILAHIGPGATHFGTTIEETIIEK